MLAHVMTSAMVSVRLSESSACQKPQALGIFSDFQRHSLGRIIRLNLCFVDKFLNKVKLRFSLFITHLGKTINIMFR